jgi:hypothetical protein
VYELPSVPVTVTWEALVADTAKVDELPEEIDTGFAVMLTVGAGTELPEGDIPEHPVNSNDSGRQDNSASEQTRPEKKRGTSTHLRPLFLRGSRKKRRSDALSRIVGSKFNKSISPHKLVSNTSQHHDCQN